MTKEHNTIIEALRSHAKNTLCPGKSKPLTTFDRNAKLGGLPERHMAHPSWPPIATIYCKYTVTKLYKQ